MMFQRCMLDLVTLLAKLPSHYERVLTIFGFTTAPYETAGAQNTEVPTIVPISIMHLNGGERYP